MCGIAGFSLTPDSGVNARHLAHHLLKGIETRGSHASGFAFSNRDGGIGVYKQAKPGSQLPLAELPRNADTVVLHTRFATQGSPKDNNNNHPVVSTDKRIALVHNGVISNDFRFRDELGITKAHGEVDSLVIPNLIAQQGISSLAKLGGYAAIAWVSVAASGVLNVMRLKQSPVHYTWLHAGGFVFASTEAILTSALDAANLAYGGVFEMGAGKHFTVTNGFILSHEPAPSMSYDSGAYGRYSGATSGGHGSAYRPTTPSTGAASGATKSAGHTSTTPLRTPATGSGTGPVGTVGSEAVNDRPLALTGGSEDGGLLDAVARDEGYPNADAYLADLEQWRARRGSDDERDAKIAAAHLACSLGDVTDDIDEVDDDEYDTEAIQRWLQHGMHQLDDEDDIDETFAKVNREGFYLVDIEGGMEHAVDLESLETRLRWYAQMGRSDGDLFTEVDEYLNWINHVQDVGHVMADGSLVSWVEDMADIDQHESPAVRNLQKVREGVERLASLKGA